MNYFKIYNQLVSKASYREFFKLIDNLEYYETHHIQPKSLGGSDESANLIKFTGKEHYVAHHLLYKMYEKTNNTNAKIKMSYAWFAMAAFDENQKRYLVKASQFEKAKKAMCQYNSGNNHHKSDTNVYNFVHRSRREFTGTRHDLADFIGIKRGGYLTRLVKDGDTYRDWILKENSTPEFFWDTYIITNGELFVSGFYKNITRSDTILKNDFRYLLDRTHGMYKGWWIHAINYKKFKPDISKKSYNSLINSILYTIQYDNTEYKVYASNLNLLPYFDLTFEEKVSLLFHRERVKGYEVIRSILVDNDNTDNTQHH